jgi:hypothetical protein
MRILEHFETTLAQLVVKKLERRFLYMKNQPPGKNARSKWLFDVD